MTYVSDLVVPEWVKNLDKSKCIPGKVYNIYECKNCMLEHYGDMKRRKRKICKAVNGKVESITRCSCAERSTFLMKYKKCFVCHGDVYGTRISIGICKSCANSHKYEHMNVSFFKAKGLYNPIEIPMLFESYRLGKLIQSKKDITKDNLWDCLNRGKCLESCFVPGGSNVKLGCTDCPDYIKTCI